MEYISAEAEILQQLRCNCLSVFQISPPTCLLYTPQ